MIQKIVFILLLLISFTAKAKFDWLEPVKIEDIFLKKHISIVFASQNLKSPVSMFGHTFLVIHAETIPEPDSIVIEFLGKTDGVSWAHLKALVSYIEGEYRLTRFILKKREYDLEDRNLWIYRLSLSENEKEKLIYNISNNLKKKNLPYTFLNQNCSHYILKLLLYEKKQNSQFLLYTLPKYTIRELQQLGYIATPPTNIHSTQFFLIKKFNELNSQDKKNVAKIVNANNTYNSQNTTPTLKKIASLAIAYKTPRESNPQIRNHYFNTQKKILAELNEKNLVSLSEPLKNNSYDPLKLFGDASLRFGILTKTRGLVLEGKLAQRDFYTSLNDGLSSSYLEILKTKIVTNDLGINISQFTIFKLDSLVSEHDYRLPFNRLFDLSFYNHNYEFNKNIGECVARYGYGTSWNYSDLTLGIIPYFGVRYFNNSSKTIELDLGITGKINYWINDYISTEASMIKYLNSKMPFNYLLELKFAIRINPRWTLGVQNIFYAKNSNMEFSMVYNF